ncbi:hypothetical protein MALU111345_12300 [Marinicrinis lubricantis]
MNLMREAGRIVAETHRFIKEAVKPGITTKELDRIAEETIRSQEAVLSFIRKEGFAGNKCVSVNDKLVHGIPGDRVLACGNMISIVIGAKYEGDHGDSAWTYPVGNVSPFMERLLQVTEQSLNADLEFAEPDIRLYTISHAIQQAA